MTGSAGASLLRTRPRPRSCARHLCRAVLRSGVRFRRHPALAWPARTFDAARRTADRPADDGGVVGVDLHLVDHQLARSREARRAADAVRADAGRPRPVLVDPARLRRARPAFRNGLCLHAGRPQPVHGVGREAPDAGNYRNFLRITVWLLLSARFLDRRRLCRGRHARLAFWGVAVAIEYADAGSLGMWVPGLGRSTTADWTIDGGHLAERCALFVIIALGESILITGATFAEQAWNTTSIAAVRRDLPRQRRHVGDLFQYRRRAGQSPDRHVATIPAAWRASAIPMSICFWWPASSSPLWPTNWFWPTRAATRTSRPSPCCWAARRFT